MSPSFVTLEDKIVSLGPPLQSRASKYGLNCLLLIGGEKTMDRKTHDMNLCVFNKWCGSLIDIVLQVFKKMLLSVASTINDFHSWIRKCDHKSP